MTRKTSFYYSFLSLPPDKRRAITAVWDLCRAVDDAVDLEPDPARAEQAADRWRTEVSRIFDGATPETPQGLAVQPFTKIFPLPRQQFDALVDGVAMDAHPRRYATFAELEPYCHGVASAVGLICAEIFGYQDASALDYARDLGVALQLTNILRDVAVDYRQGRLYLPLDDLARFGCTEDDVREAVNASAEGFKNDRLRAVLEYHAARAKVFFSRADRLLPKSDARNFVAAEIMGAVYREILRRIEAARYDVFSQVMRVPRPAQARLAIKTWWRLRG